MRRLRAIDEGADVEDHRLAHFEPGFECRGGHVGGEDDAMLARQLEQPRIDAVAAFEHIESRAGQVPALDFAVGHTRPFDARSMMDAGLTLALATDMCPGCWLESMPFVVQLACRLYKFSPAEAIRAGTLHAAMALNRADRIGSLEPGKQADIAIFPFDRYEDMAYRLGRGRASLAQG